MIHAINHARAIHSNLSNCQPILLIQIYVKIALQTANNVKNINLTVFSATPLSICISIHRYRITSQHKYQNVWLRVHRQHIRKMSYKL